MKNVYVAGKMRGVEEFNFPAFDVATEILRDAGYFVFSPAERDRAAGFDPSGMTGNEDLSKLGFSLREALAADTQWIAMEADAVYLLDGWENSSGARAEKALAEALGLEVLYQTDLGSNVRTPSEQTAYDEGYDDGTTAGYGSGSSDGYSDSQDDGPSEWELSELEQQVAYLESELADALGAVND